MSGLFAALAAMLASIVVGALLFVAIYALAKVAFAWIAKTWEDL